MNLWNELVAIINKTKKKKVRNHAQMLLSQLKTAGGKELIRHEIEVFVWENR